MQNKQTLFSLLFLFLSFFSFSQTTYLPQGARENILLERLEIKAGTDSILNFSKTKPFSRKQFIPVIEKYYLKSSATVDMVPVDMPQTQVKELSAAKQLSDVDRYNAQLALMKNSEWSTQKFTSKKTFWKNFYRSPANFYEVNTKDFSLVLNPVFQYVAGKEKDNSEYIFLNSRGLVLRGMIANKIGFAAYITENQERVPKYVQALVAERQAVPGAGFYKDFKNTAYDYLDARGYITFNAAKYIDITFGYDRNFIGNGHRSLLLSDFANNALFLKLNTRIWKLNYQNLFMELVKTHPRNFDIFRNKKYAAIHHLDVGVTKWLNIGVFEGVVFGRPDHFEFGYLNPVIFYRSAELDNGSFDNGIAGFDAKANLKNHLQLYGQFLIDEFKIHELKNKWWGNKFGFQLGGKYIDAFGINNLDLQAEWNRVRPFTYAHADSVANYTHDNQPLAHPLGANFNEWNWLVRYQPAAKWMLQAKAVFYKQGKDTSSVSYGSNIFLIDEPPYRTMDYGYEVGSGALTKVDYTSFLLSYELKPNFFLETNAVIRKQTAFKNNPAQNTFVIYAGIRWNMHRREFDF